MQEENERCDEMRRAALPGIMRIHLEAKVKAQAKVKALQN